ncbi:ABC transporter permease [Paenibacillus sp. Soil724D2]|uniref:ABC transporter permease n=1 Tax=Paenibacillus sp. (strain Soil724D2) TaxID=1736392 RepID=UPI000715DD7A|nr:protein lplB [Paenibacillus sp. Soil724D2]
MDGNINKAPRPSLTTSELKALQLRRRRRLKQNIPLFIMLFPVIAYYILFKYWPMGGLVIAFKNYNFADGILHSPWVGLKNFKVLFSSTSTIQIIWNTFWLSFLNLLIGFPVPIFLAILLNEVRKTWFKKWVQTIVYLPHFFSWVIVGGLVLSLFATDYGSINKILKLFNIEPITFLYESKSWVAVFVGSGVWKEMGFSTIIYLAALTNIDPALYESAGMDGASKWRQIWHITIPGIRHTIILLLILAMGQLMEVGFDQIYNLQNSAVADVSEVISTYIYKIGLGNAQFSVTTAMGLFESIIGCTLVLVANRIARKFDQALF